MSLVFNMVGGGGGGGRPDSATAGIRTTDGLGAAFDALPQILAGMLK